MKRLILISYLILNIYSCVQAKRSPQDPNSPTSFLINLLSSNTSFSSTSSQIPSVTFFQTTFVFSLGESISIVPSVSNIKSCTISPTLPSGISIDSKNCSIVGTANSISSNQAYTITATNGSNSRTAIISLLVGSIYRTYITSTTVNGNITTATADTTCNSNINKPNSGTYKAVIVGSTRRACSTSYCSGGVSENLDWVFKATSSYFRSDGTTLVGKTNTSGIFASGTNTTFNNSFSNSSLLYWTGINLDYTNNSNNCVNWTSNSGANNGIIGNSLSNDTALSSSLFACNTSNYLLCVEQ